MKEFSFYYRILFEFKWVNIKLSATIVVIIWSRNLNYAPFLSQKEPITSSLKVFGGISDKIFFLMSCTHIIFRWLILNWNVWAYWDIAGFSNVNYNLLLYLLILLYLGGRCYQTVHSLSVGNNNFPFIGLSLILDIQSKYKGHVSVR